MPVIGRLDGQVEEVIINPISERRRRDEPPPPPEGRGAPEPHAPDAPDPVQTPHPDESSAEPTELPVWLL